MMKELRTCIHTAQEEVRKAIEAHVKDKDVTELRNVAEIEGLLPRERQCFADCRAIYARFLPRLSKDEFDPPMPS